MRRETGHVACIELPLPLAWITERITKEKSTRNGGSRACGSELDIPSAWESVMDSVLVLCRCLVQRDDPESMPSIGRRVQQEDGVAPLPLFIHVWDRACLLKCKKTATRPRAYHASLLTKSAAQPMFSRRRKMHFETGNRDDPSCFSFRMEDDKLVFCLGRFREEGLRGRGTRLDVEL